MPPIRRLIFWKILVVFVLGGLGVEALQYIYFFCVCVCEYFFFSVLCLRVVFGLKGHFQKRRSLIRLITLSPALSYESLLLMQSANYVMVFPIWFGHTVEICSNVWFNYGRLF